MIHLEISTIGVLGDQNLKNNNKKDDNLSSIKFKIHEFHGKSDPEVYIE